MADSWYLRKEGEFKKTSMNFLWGNGERLLLVVEVWEREKEKLKPPSVRRKSAYLGACLIPLITI